jgi:PAS domain S-box-containing protein
MTSQTDSRFTQIARAESHPSTEPPAAASAGALADRRELAFIAVERTRMPMVVTDPRQPDHPIVLANQAFLELGGYRADEVVGRNCRFMQGPGTDPRQIDKIRQAICDEQEAVVELLNYKKDGSTFWNELFLSPVHDDDGRLLYFFGSCKDISKRRQAYELEAEEYRLLREVDHRAKNALALVQGIVRLSRAEDIEAYAKSVQARVEALARAHSLLSALRWRDVPVSRLIEAQADLFSRRRIRMEGPLVELPAEYVQPLALMLYEMLSNAAQHGALSVPEGRVSISWRTEGEDLVLDWQETGGPPPKEDREPSFGSTLIGATVERQLGGRAQFDWKQEGLESRFEVPIRKGRDKPPV